MLTDKEKMSVTEIYVKLRLEQSVASQHLAIMRRAGVVTTTRSGKNIFYQLDNDRLKSIGNFIRDISNTHHNQNSIMAKTTDQKAFLSVDISKLEKSVEIMRAPGTSAAHEDHGLY